MRPMTAEARMRKREKVLSSTPSNAAMCRAACPRPHSTLVTLGRALHRCRYHRVWHCKTVILGHGSRLRALLSLALWGGLRVQGRGGGQPRAATSAGAAAPPQTPAHVHTQQPWARYTQRRAAFHRSTGLVPWTHQAHSMDWANQSNSSKRHAQIISTDLGAQDGEGEVGGEAREVVLGARLEVHASREREVALHSDPKLVQVPHRVRRLLAETGGTVTTSRAGRVSEGCRETGGSTQGNSVCSNGAPRHHKRQHCCCNRETQRAWNRSSASKNGGCAEAGS